VDHNGLLGEVEKLRQDIKEQHVPKTQTLKTMNKTWNSVEVTLCQEAKRAGKEREWTRRKYRLPIEFLTPFESLWENLGRLEQGLHLLNLGSMIPPDSVFAERSSFTSLWLQPSVETIVKSCSRERNRYGSIQTSSGDTDDLYKRCVRCQNDRGQNKRQVVPRHQTVQSNSM
jgi:hypothetical protein